MSIEESIRARLNQLIAESTPLSMSDENDQCTDPRQEAACSAWITAAHNAVYLVIPQPDAPYRKKTDRIAEAKHGYGIHQAVRELASVLSSLLKDGDAGLLASVADQARAEAFDDFLDHAAHYLRYSKKQEAGVIAGVVFEDSLRRICRKLGLVEKGQPLDALISELASRNELSAVKAKRARAAADVRTKATHAQWGEFELDDVRSTIEFTRDLIETKLT
ncbi:MAG: hypothetical protein ACOH1Q_07730 [Thiobacillus sp.]